MKSYERMKQIETFISEDIPIDVSENIDLILEDLKSFDAIKQAYKKGFIEFKGTLPEELTKALNWIYKELTLEEKKHDK